MPLYDLPDGLQLAVMDLWPGKWHRSEPYGYHNTIEQTLDKGMKSREMPKDHSPTRGGLVR